MIYKLFILIKINFYKADLKSAGAYPPWGFKSPSGHHRAVDLEIYIVLGHVRVNTIYFFTSAAGADRDKFKLPNGSAVICPDPSCSVMS